MAKEMVRRRVARGGIIILRFFVAVLITAGSVYGTVEESESGIQLEVFWDLEYRVGEEAADALEILPQLREILEPKHYLENAPWLQGILPPEESLEGDLSQVRLEEFPMELLQFLKLSEPVAVTEEDLEKILEETPLEGFGPQFKEAADREEMNALYLITKGLWETEINEWDSPKGRIIIRVGEEPVTPRRVYNLLGIHPPKDSLAQTPYEYAYLSNWFTPEQSLLEGSQHLASEKIHSLEDPGDTLFKKAWEQFETIKNLENIEDQERAVLILRDKQQWQREKLDYLYTALNLSTYTLEFPMIGLEELINTEQLAEEGYTRYWPVPTQRHISSYFGYRKDPFDEDIRFHLGIDIPEGMEAPISAAKSGRVIVSHKGSSYGNWIEIDHGDGWTTRYAHNHQNLVAVGDEVQKGQVIALIGSTGRSTGPHLHFEVRKNGEAVNPLDWLAEEGEQ